MRQNQKVLYSLGLAISLSSAIAISQQLPVDREVGADEGPLNDIHRGLSRVDEQRNRQIELVWPIRRIGRNPATEAGEFRAEPGYRRIDGRGNNRLMRDMNSHNSALHRLFGFL